MENNKLFLIRIIDQKKDNKIIYTRALEVYTLIANSCHLQTTVYVGDIVECNVLINEELAYISGEILNFNHDVGEIKLKTKTIIMTEERSAMCAEMKGFPPYYKTIEIALDDMVSVRRIKA